MIVRVRLGLLLAPIRAMEALTLELADRATIAELCDHVAERRPAHASGVRLATAFVNGEQVGRAYLVADGDEVALMLPMVGG